MLPGFASGGGMDKRDDGIVQLLYNARAEFTALKARCKAGLFCLLRLENHGN